MEGGGSRIALLFGFILALALCVVAGMAATSALGVFQRRTSSPPTPTQPSTPQQTTRPTSQRPTRTPRTPTAIPTPLTVEIPPSPTFIIATLQPTPLPEPPTTTATSIPSPTPPSEATSTPTFTPSSTATPTTTPSPAPYTGPFRQGNGADLRARHASSPLRIDGDLSEWAESAGQDFNYILLGAETYGGLPDAGGTLYTQWDADFLYLSVRVSDDIIVQVQRGERMDQGDSLVAWLDINLAEDFDNQTANEDDFQIGLSPGDFATIPAEAVIWKPPLPPERAQSIIVASRRTGDGYTVEANIPWALLGRPPTTGSAFGFATLLIDNDQPATSGQDTVLSGAPNFRPGVPTSWSNLILD